MKKTLKNGIIFASIFTLATSGVAQAETMEPVAYESSEGWSISYLPELMTMSEENDVVNFVYAGSAPVSGTVNISYTADKMPQEVLYEQIADIDDYERVTRTEGFFAGTNEWAFTYSVAPENEEDFREQFTGIEHNGGTLLFSIKTENADEELSLAVFDTIEELVGSFTFTDHQPQEQFSYVPGTYYQDYTDILDGQELTVTYSVELAPDHTGTLHLQDDVEIVWTSTELITADAAYPYTIEGDALLIEFDENAEWQSFEKNTID